MENMENSKEAEDSSADSGLVDSTNEDHFFENREIILSKVFFGLIIAGVFEIIIAIIWSIGDAIRPDGKWELFLQLPLYNQIFIVALLGLFLLIIGIFLTVFYRRGRQWILDGLFGKKPFHSEKAEEYLPAKIIAGGLLISIFIVFAGLIIAIIQEYIIGIDSTGLIGFINEQTGGVRLLIVGLFIQVLLWLMVGFTYLWQNGYYFVMNYILDYNNKIQDGGYNEKQRIVGRVFFVITVFSIILIICGIVYSIFDAIQPTGKWETFKTYSLGLQFAIVGSSGAFLFALLVLSMVMYKRGNIIILNALFMNRNKELEKNEKTTIAKGLTWGILIAICAIFVSVVMYLISVGFEASGVNIFTLGSLSGGLTLLLIGIIILVFDVLILLFTFVYKNGYSVMVVQIIKTQDNFEKWLFKRQEAKRKKEEQKAATSLSKDTEN